MPGFEVGTRVKYIDHGGRYARTSNQQFAAAVKIGGRAGLEVARSKAPNKTGALAASIYMRAQGHNVAIIGSGSPYAERTELGGKSYPITGNMKFFWEKEGRMFGRPYPNKVTHPRTKARPYLRPGLVAAEEAIIAYLKAVL